MLNKLLCIGEEVKQALSKGLPLVALESSLLTHGLPYPQNLVETKAIEQQIRDQGAIPVTIALDKGKILLGLDETKLDYFAKTEKIPKVSKRDLAFFLSRQFSATTSLAAALFCAHLAGLAIFVTGGIGGTNYHPEEYFNVSSDLIELSSTPITVICSGAKSILDLPKTLEILETHGVPIIGYATDEFPAFYSQSSGIPLFHRLDSVQEIANLMHYQNNLQMNSGIVIANPISSEMNIALGQGMPLFKEANPEKKTKKALTPFLLERMATLSSRQSLEANIALIKRNASLAAKIAVAYYKLNA